MSSLLTKFRPAITRASSSILSSGMNTNRGSSFTSQPSASNYSATNLLKTVPITNQFNRAQSFTSSAATPAPKPPSLLDRWFNSLDQSTREKNPQAQLVSKAPTRKPATGGPFVTQGLSENKKSAPEGVLWRAQTQGPEVFDPPGLEGGTEDNTWLHVQRPAGNKVDSAYQGNTLDPLRVDGSTVSGPLAMAHGDYVAAHEGTHAVNVEHVQEDPRAPDRVLKNASEHPVPPLGEGEIATRGIPHDNFAFLYHKPSGRVHVNPNSKSSPETMERLLGLLRTQVTRHNENVDQPSHLPDPHGYEEAQQAHAERHAARK